MRKTVSVKIGNTNPPQKFDTTLDVQIGDRVIVETPTGSEWGIVNSRAIAARENSKNNFILRLADAEDNKIIDKLITSANYAIKVTNEKVERLKLPMKVLSASYAFDSGKVIIQFFAENRVDFRELVKELAYALRTRIELRQVGSRDEVKIVEALGPCGQECCCVRFLNNFDNITIKMARNQNISLNPQKINGMCGRLLCCLGYENEHYTEMNEKMPKYCSPVQTPDGRGIAQDNNMIKETVNVKFQTGDTTKFGCYKLCDVKCQGCRK